jgi:hypothetical protein
MIQQCSLGKGIVAFYAIHSYELVAVAGRFVVCRKPDSRGRDRSWSKYPRNEQDLLRAHKVTGAPILVRAGKGAALLRGLWS